MNNKIRILGIHSSPIKHGNTAHLLEFALAEAAKSDEVETEFISLAGLEISDCIQCNWCIRKQTADRLCSIRDDAPPILEKIRKCAVLVLASPVYFARLSGTMACLIDRTRCFIFGKNGHMALKGKIGVALTVGWERNVGIETTLESIHNAFLVHEMWTPSCHRAGAVFGAGVVSGQRDEDLSYKSDKLGAMQDKVGLRSAKLLMRAALQSARLLKP